MEGVKRLVVIFSSAAVLAGAVYFGYCYWSLTRPPLVSVVNHSDKALEEVVLSGAGFSESLGKISPHETVTRTVRPSGESGLGIAFVADSRPMSKNGLAYIESTGGYQSEIQIGSDLGISCKNSFR